MVADQFANLTGKNAVVTGSSSGIGRATAMLLAQGGANVVVHCNTSVAAANSVAKDIKEVGRKCVVISADVAIQRDCERLVDESYSELGPIDIWVNNAGVDLLTGDASNLNFDHKLQRLFEIDVSSTVKLSRVVGARMRDQDGGSIINIGWDQADRGMEGDSGEMFAACKNAIMGFTRSLAVSLAPTVRVNCVAPGWIKTAWGDQASDYWQQRVIGETPLRRWGTAEDVAKAIRFLASDDSEFITGQVINVNGGAVR